ncbi:dockerin type I repeat-containing protein [Geobacter sp. AOG1]|uniref:dockerin type I repeat-containing protein n=1 Tax=Geobacter sp. AOG1 TaxID=1566346 RepID=UPI001CC63563
MTAGASVSLSAPLPAVAGPVTYPSATSWTATIDNLSTGLNTINVAARNLAGSTSQSVTVSRLLPAPQLDITRVANYTAQSSQTIGGSVAAGSAVTIGNDRNGTVSANVDGSSWSGSVPLLPGTNTITVTASQPGSAIATVVTAIILDNAAPVLSVSAIADGSYTSTPTQNVSGTVSDPWLDKVTVNGQPVVLTGDRFSSAVTLSGGSNSIIVTATDLAGNTSIDRRTVYFDTTLPVISVTVPADNAYTSQETVTVSGTTDKPAIVTVNGIAAGQSDSGWQADVRLGAGLNTVLIAATDQYGNNSSLKRSITLDREAPVIAISQPGQDLATASPNLMLAGTASDATPFTLTASVNGQPVPLTLTGGAFGLPLEFAAEGPYVVTLTATDAAGNVSSSTRSITYDVTPPTLTVNPVTGYYPERLSGTVETGATVTTSDKNGPVGRVVIESSVWNADLSGVSYDSATLRITAVDAAGNQSTRGLVVHEPDGDLNDDGSVTMADALLAIRIVTGGAVPTADNLAHGDIGPLLAGRPNPNGKIDLVDALLILRRAVGLSSW